MKTVVTHSGNFHSDDVFAVAAFQLLLGEDNVKVIRTRDDEEIKKGDIVVDVGGVYDHAKRRYDHHQPGAPVRENGIPYAGFGLMWKHYGEEICGNKRVAEVVDEQLCQPIDAGDNGVELYKLSQYSVRPFELYNIIASFRPKSDNVEALEKGFIDSISFAKRLLERLIVNFEVEVETEEKAKTVYESAIDKTVLILDQPIDRHYFSKYPEVLAVVYPSFDATRGEVWKVGMVPDGKSTFGLRANLPKEWSGLRDEELAEISGIHDAIFCHKTHWRFVASSKESAIKAAKMAE